MMKCWKNDPDARPTFTELKNQLKDMETLHKVRIFFNMKVSFHVRPTNLGLANQGFKLNSVQLRQRTFYEVGIASSCYVTEASTPRKTRRKRTRMSLRQLTHYGYLKDGRIIAKLY